MIVGIALVALGLAGVGGAGYALMRVRSRPPAPEATSDNELPMPAHETRLASIEDELQELIAMGSAHQAPDVSRSEQEPSRETADSPS